VTIGDVSATAGHPPLVLVHGFLLSGHTSIEPWARATLAPSRALILPDNLGYGFSERIPTPGEHYTLASYARDLAGLLDQMGIRQVDLAGHSWGGVIAAQFAHDFPQRVRRLVIIDGGFFFPKSSPLEKVTYLPLGIGRAVVWNTLAGGRFSYVWRICSTLRNCEAAGPVAYIKDTTPTLQAMMLTSRATDGMAAIEAKLGDIDTQTLVLWGALDQIASVAKAERLARELPHARLKIVEDAWHMPWLQEPAQTAKPLLEFLDAP
jgi:pimeloyl-ACP methyl ester carboxylesterase